MQKKFIAMLLAATMVFSLAGCGDKPNNDNQGGGNSTPASDTTPADNNGGQGEAHRNL